MAAINTIAKEWANEIRDGIVACKDMQTGEQTTLDPKATIYRIKAGLEARNQGAVIRE